MRITDENGKRVAEPDGISDKWLFLDVSVTKGATFLNVARQEIEENRDVADFVDELASGGGYECKGTPTGYINKIEGEGILWGMPEVAKRGFFELLSALVKTVKDNTNKPARAKGKMYEECAKFDEMQEWGIIVQTLAMQVLYEWLEGFSIKMGDNGYYEYEAVLVWVGLCLYDLLCRFCQFRCLNLEKDRELCVVVVPLCNYLYKTEKGRLVQYRIKCKCFGVESVADTIGTGTGAETHTDARKPMPKELDTPEGRGLLQSLINAGYCNKDYYWDSGRWKAGKGRIALACFVVKASDYLKLSSKEVADGNQTRKQTRWKPFEELFEFDGKSKNKEGNYSQIQQANKDYKNRQFDFNPEEMNDISKFFEGLPDAFQ